MKKKLILVYIFLVTMFLVGCGRSVDMDRLYLTGQKRKVPIK